MSGIEMNLVELGRVAHKLNLYFKNFSGLVKTIQRDLDFFAEFGLALKHLEVKNRIGAAQINRYLVRFLDKGVVGIHSENMCYFAYVYLVLSLNEDGVNHLAASRGDIMEICSWLDTGKADYFVKTFNRHRIELAASQQVAAPQ